MNTSNLNKELSPCCDCYKWELLKQGDITEKEFLECECRAFKNWRDNK